MQKKTNLLALITGATGGLGSVLVDQFLQQGYDVFMLARNEAKLAELKKQLRQKYSQKIESYAIDFSQPDVQELEYYCRQKNLFPDVLVNNAGITGSVGPSYQLSYEQYQQALLINFGWPVELCRLFVPEMIERKYGKIIQISGGGATGPRENFSPYATSKTALIRYTENLAAELELLRPEIQIDVNAIAPGAMKTAMTAEILQMDRQMVGDREITSLSKKLQNAPTPPELAAELCLYLASEQANGISGRLLSANWDRWHKLSENLQELRNSDIYTLRRITARDRGKKDWDK